MHTDTPAISRAVPNAFLTLLRIVLPVFWALVLAVALIAISPAPARAFDVQLALANDAFTNSPHPDDLYSFGGGISFMGDTAGVVLEERSFTDRTAELRFDETYLTVRRRFSEIRGPFGRPWSLEVAAGVAHVGEGLLGQSVQNTVHRWIGSDRVDLPYIDRDRYHAHVQIEAAQPLLASPLFATSPWFDVEATPGFRYSAALGLRWSWQAVSWLRLDGTAGARHTQSELEALECWVEDFAPSVEVSTLLGERYRLTWSYNAYGTGDQHWHLSIHTGLGKRLTGKKGRRAEP